MHKALESWFRRVKRPMPWRKTPTPYFCWLSEIMMQQTTYQSVLPYFTRFVKRFPTVQVLARASESAVLKSWEGLGYYARARNLLKAAKSFVKGARVAFPASAAEWARVPGVGPYTAAALASVLSGERVPVVDGNVARVFSRVWELTDNFHQLPARAALAGKLQPLVDRANVPGDFNQAMMELGALVCTPTNPACDACPLARFCAARKNGTQNDFPKKQAKKILPVRTGMVVVVRDAKERVLLVQKKDGGLLKGLWELPAIEQGASHAQTFSHFKEELLVFEAVTTVAQFKDPKKVPLTTATRKILFMV